MRTLLLLTALSAFVLTTSCLEDRCMDTVTYQSYTPVTVEATDWRTSSFEFKDATVDVCQPSGFYVYGDYLFLVDRNQGVYIYDNRDNDNPVPIRFIAIPGAQGIAVRNDILYLSQYLDVVAFDLSQPTAPAFVSRTEDVFAARTVFAGTMPSGAYIVDYLPNNETVEVECTDPRNGSNFWIDDIFFALDCINCSVVRTTAGTEQLGQGGSLARFTISQSTLYAVDDNQLRAFSLENPKQPELSGVVDLGWGIETIFPYKDQLYIGSTTGVHIYDVTQPLAPEHLSTFTHVLSCDPVVVQNDLAYVTMWGGSNCGNQQDQLIILDVRNPRQPHELQTVALEQSHGLGVTENRLYLCSGTEGIRVFELTAQGLLGAQIGQYRDFNAKDIIVRPDRSELIVFGWEQAGIRQFDYTISGQLTPVSDLNSCQ